MLSKTLCGSKILHLLFSTIFSFNDSAALLSTKRCYFRGHYKISSLLPFNMTWKLNAIQLQSTLEPLWVWFWTLKILGIPFQNGIILEIKGIFKCLFSPFSPRGTWSRGSSRTRWDPSPGLTPLWILPWHQAQSMALVITVVINYSCKSSTFSLGFMHECTKVMSRISIFFLFPCDSWLHGKTNLSLPSLPHNSSQLVWRERLSCQMSCISN